MMVRTMDEPEEGRRWGRTALWTALAVVGLFIGLVAIGYTAAHLKHSGQMEWSRRLITVGPLLLIGLPTALLIWSKTRIPQGATLGERKEAGTRRLFWGMMGGSAFFALVTSAVLQSSGAGTSMFSSSALSPATAITLSLAYLIGGAAAAIVYFGRMDELETRDNMWGATAAATVVLFVYPPWLLLWRAQLMGEPSHYAIYGLLIASYTVVYLWRKARR